MKHSFGRLLFYPSSARDVPRRYHLISQELATNHAQTAIGYTTLRNIKVWTSDCPCVESMYCADGSCRYPTLEPFPAEPTFYKRNHKPSALIVTLEHFS